MALGCFFGFAFYVNSSSAAVDPTYTTHLTDLEGEVQKEILSTQNEINTLLAKLNRVEQAPEKGPQRLISGENPHLRKKLKGYLNAAIKMKVRHLDYLKKQKSYLVGDHHIAQSLLPLETLKKTTEKLSGAFKCEYFPLKRDEESTTFEKVYSFGDFINPSLGKSSAKTQGVWWGNTFGSLVRSCASGEVVMSEFIEGRGHVVGIRHNSRDITLYGNLDATSLKSLKTGMKVPEGAPLGFALERFYFEARRGSEAVDPDEVTGQNQDLGTIN